MDMRHGFAGSSWTVALFAGVIACTCACAAVHVTARPAPRPTVGGNLEHRVRVLTKALELDVRQQSELERILEDQRVAVIKIWSDSALPPAERGPATRAVEDRTAEHIRGILSEEQRKLYNPPKPQSPASTPPSVTDWMETQARRSE